MSKIILVDTEHEESVSIFLSNHASMVAEMPERLKTGITHFAFKKADGSTREAFGTLDPKFMPVRTPEEIEAQAGKAKNPLVLNYWDLDAQGWRAFTKANLLVLY